MAPTTVPEFNDFRRRLYDLPQELFDQIADLTFAFGPSSVPILDWNYKPPWQLQINRKLRQDFTKLYYGPPDVWHFTCPLPESASRVAKKWSFTLDKEARVLIDLEGVRKAGTPFDRILTMPTSLEYDISKINYPDERATESGEPPVVRVAFYISSEEAFRYLGSC